MQRPLLAKRHPPARRPLLRRWQQRMIVGGLIGTGVLFSMTAFHHFPHRDPFPADVCSISLDCELNGICQKGQCLCDKAWRGTNCEQLSLKPSGVNDGYRKDHVATWGGNVVERRDEQESDKRFHLFAAEIVGGCGLKAWNKNSQIMHAVADRKEGPYTRKDTVLPSFAHNPQIVRAPDGTYLLFHIGNASGSDLIQCPVGNGTTPSQCDDSVSESSTYTQQQTPHQVWNSSSLQANYTFPLHYSDSLYGPWQPVTASIDFSVGSNANPAPVVLSNGTVLIIFNAKGMAMAEADHWRGPYQLRTTGACGNGEDPFLFVDNRGHFHCLTHAAPFNHPTKSIVHSYSEDGFNWHISKAAAGGSKVTFNNGQTVLFSKRERPKLLFDKNNEPTHLVTGLTLTPQCAPCFLYPAISNCIVDQLPDICGNETLQYYLTNKNPCPGNYDLAFTHIQQLL